LVVAGAVATVVVVAVVVTVAAALDEVSAAVVGVVVVVMMRINQSNELIPFCVYLSFVFILWWERKDAIVATKKFV
jgi:hypothetical protein